MFLWAGTGVIGFFCFLPVAWQTQVRFPNSIRKQAPKGQGAKHDVAGSRTGASPARTWAGHAGGSSESRLPGRFLVMRQIWEQAWASVYWSRINGVHSESGHSGGQAEGQHPCSVAQVGTDTLMPAEPAFNKRNSLYAVLVLILNTISKTFV